MEPLVDTATYQELLHSNHSKTHNFKKSRNEGGGGGALATKVR